MPAATMPTVIQRVGNFNSAIWKPLMNTRLDQGYILETYRNGVYGNYFDLLDLVGRKINLTTDNPKIFEKLPWENTITTGTEIAIGAAGGDISFTLATTSQDTVLPKEVFTVPGTYQASGEPRQYQVTSVTAHVVTASPRSADGTTITAAEISVAVPAGTIFSITSQSNHRGGSLPNGKYNYRVVRDYQTTIQDVVRTYEGGMQALKWLEVQSETGGSTALLQGQEDMENDLSKYCEGAFFLDELNDNTTLTATSGAGGTVPYKATKGLFTWAKEVGSPLNYAGGAFPISYLYDVKDLFLAKLVASTEASLLMGSDLNRLLEEGNLDVIKEYSGGSDLFRKMDEIGINVKRVLFNDILFNLQEVKSLSNPLRFGNPAYNYSKSGIIVPESLDAASYNGSEEKHPATMIGYLNNNGEDRTRILGFYNGTTGRSSQVSHTADFDTAFIKTEFAAIVLRPEQLITVEPE